MFTSCGKSIRKTYSCKEKIEYPKCFKIPKSINILCCVFVSLFVSNKRLNGWTVRAQFFVWNLTWPQGRFIKDQNFKIRLKLNSISIKFENPLHFFIKFAKFLFVFISPCIQRENAHNWNRIWARSALKT